MVDGDFGGVSENVQGYAEEAVFGADAFGGVCVLWVFVGVVVFPDYHGWDCGDSESDGDFYVGGAVSGVYGTFLV